MDSLPSLHRHQDAALEIALELTRLGHRLSRIATSIPLPVDVDELFEDRAASTPASHLYGVVGAVRFDLCEASEALLEAARADEVTLRQAHWRWEQRPS